MGAAWNRIKRHDPRAARRAPAQLDMAVFTAAEQTPSQIPINQCVDFGNAALIPGNTPVAWTQLEPIEPDRKLMDHTEQEHATREWITG